MDARCDRRLRRCARRIPWTQAQSPTMVRYWGASLLGATIGLSTGMAWGTRHLTGDMARGAKKNIDAARDSRWLEKNPIDYA